MRMGRRTSINWAQHQDKIVIGLLILILLIATIGSLGHGRTYVLTDGKETDTPGLNQFCLSFVEQILGKRLHNEMVEPDIYEVLVQNNYEVLGLLGSETPLFSKAQDDNCSVVIKDKLGLRRFNIWVNKSLEYPFYYRVRKVDEPAIEG